MSTENTNVDPDADKPLDPTQDQNQEQTTPATEATPPQEEPAKKIPDVTEKQEEDTVSTGNPFVDELLTELKSHEVDVDKLFGDYLETGNEESIDIAYLESKVGKLAAKGLVASVKAEAERLEKESEAAAQTIYDAVEGKETWEAIINWIASGESGLTKEGAQAYNAMLDSGPVQATLAAKELLNMFKQSPGFVQPAKLEGADQAAKAKGIEPISRIAYVEQLDEVVRKYGENSPEAQALHKRRLFSMGNGA